jgi:hypothetical protein
MRKIIWIGLIVTSLILGLIIGYTMNSTPAQSQENYKSFIIEFEKNVIYASTSDCSNEYERLYGYKFGDCKISSAHVGERFIDRVDCSCWQ